jgi:transposase-like protein
MTAPRNPDPLFQRRHFEQELIILCVRWYISYKLSYRDLTEMMAERGVAVADTTLLPVDAALCARIRKTMEAVRASSRLLLAHG